jgi:hypothetical protein
VHSDFIKLSEFVSMPKSVKVVSKLPNLETGIVSSADASTELQMQAQRE